MMKILIVLYECHQERDKLACLVFELKKAYLISSGITMTGFQRRLLGVSASWEKPFTMI